MVMVMGSVYDSKVKVWSQPHLFVNRGAMLRAWEEAANDPQSPFSKHPADFTMFVVGEWNDETGQAVMFHAQESLGTALQFKRDQQLPFMANVENINRQEAQQ